ncbi:MAG: CHAT domain-containing protein, partial [Bacteroidetes bacterium]
EHTKAVLLQAGWQDREAQVFANVPESLRKEEKELRLRKNYLEHKIWRMEQQPQQQKTTDSLKGLLFESRLAYDQLREKLAEVFPTYQELRFSQQHISPQLLRRELLNTGEVLLEYFAGEKFYYLFVLSHSDMRILSIPRSPALQHQLAQFRSMLDPTASSLKADLQELNEFCHTAFSLKQQLLPAELDHSAYQRLIIVTDGPLSYLPFEVLIDSLPANPGKYSSLPYLLNKHTITYSFSASFLLQTQNKQTGPAHFLALAPTFEPQFLSTQSNPSTRRGDPQATLADLPGARKELQLMTTLFCGKALQGAAATEASFKELAPRYGLLLLATHAIVNDEDPMAAYLVFSQDQQSGQTEANNGRLHIWELYNLQLQAQLAVLSACKTGFGKLQRGEGVLSLGRAFAYAGVPSTVMSLWPVNDASTAILMESFFRELANGQSKDSALRNAKLRFLKRASGLQNHPRFWAGFVVQGDPQPIQLVKNNHFAWLFATVSGLALVILSLFWFRSKFSSN